MKKSLIVIALALLIMVPVFAANTGSDVASTTPVVIDTKDSSSKAQPVGDSTPLASAGKKTSVTEVGVTLDLYPIYYAAITNGDVTTGTPITRNNYDTDAAFKNVDKITMTVDTKTYRLNTSDTKYISYFFYENTEKVGLTVTLDSNLTTTAQPASNDQNAVKDIKYVADIIIDGTTTKTLHSDLSGDGNSFQIYYKEATKKVADSASHSYAFTLSQESGDTLENNIAGYYTSTITLALAAL